MMILTNNKNEIISYSVTGSIENGQNIEKDILPDDFIINFQIKKYLFKENTITSNPSFTEGIKEDNEPTHPDVDILKTMVSALQKQSVETNVFLNKLKTENEKL